PPSMPVLDLMLQMRQSKKHMAMVIDEYGGIDGLVTIGDVLEAIVGEIDDEFDLDEHPEMIERNDGSVLADARVDIDEFEERYGELLTEEERNDIDTLGGLVFSVAGRIPARGEVLKHDSGIVFEILDADPRRINRLRIKNIPEKTDEG
ncbi:MAG: transporter associated domain-containing protein, partial [Pseudomonadota bacterium]